MTSTDWQTISIYPCHTEMLEYLLIRDVEYVWLDRFCPHEIYGWWKATVPISKSFSLETADIRSPAYDVLLPTADFLSALRHFAPSGLDLYQLHERIPDGLFTTDSNRSIMKTILAPFGVVAHFFLPHAGEVGQFSTTHSDHIARVSHHPAFADKLLRAI